MLLKELFQILPEDYGTLPVPNIPSFDPKYSKVVGKFDGYDIWASREIPDNDVFGIRDVNGDVLSTCRIASDGIDKVHVFEEVWTREDQRGKGLATILLLFLMRKIGIKLLLKHDAIVSDNSRGMIWKGLSGFKFKMFRLDGTQIDLIQAKSILFTLGRTKEEVILSESVLNFKIFSDTKLDGPPSQWHFVKGMNQDLD